MTGMRLFQFSLFLFPSIAFSVSQAQVPEEFVDVADVNGNIRVEMRYFSEWNFTGRLVPGYESNRCLLVKEAAQALSKVQERLEKTGHGLLVFDCYRPQKAVKSFVDWTKSRDDQKMKESFFPDEPKTKLVARGYIDSLSGHSRGGTVDLTIVKTSAIPIAGGASAPSAAEKLVFQESVGDCRTPKNIEATGQLDMGTNYDCFSELAQTGSAKISKEAQANRRLLKSAMEKAGFVNYPKEWWHYTLRNEPFKDRAFDFNIVPKKNP